jgi:hypothetical protein
MTIAVLLRVGLAAPGGRMFETSAGGLADWAAVIVAACLSPSVRRMVTPLFWLLNAAAVWTALMIPAALGSKVAVTNWPSWMPWTLWTFTWASLLFIGFVTAQEALDRRRHRLAWPDHLEWLVDRPDPWPGFRPSAAAVALGLLPLGAYHADSFLCAPLAALSGAASLWLAHRLWNPNFADVGMALITLAVVSFPVACIPASVGGPTLDTRLPLLLGAVLLGLSVMTFLWQWLPRVWDQQLEDGRAWTTTGRMIPITGRFGSIVGAFGVIVGMQLAIWPEISSTRDDTLPRWGLGLLANAVFIASLILAARLSQLSRIGVLALLALGVAALFVGVRMPGNAVKYWLISHWPVAAALGAPVCVALCKLTDRGRWRPFAEPFEYAAVFALPLAAVAGVIVTSVQQTAYLPGELIQYDAPSLWAETFAVLAVSYGLHLWLRGRKVSAIPAVACSIVAAASLGRVLGIL